MCQPGSRIMLAVTPWSDRIAGEHPAGALGDLVAVRAAPRAPSAARSVAPKARQVSGESWSRTPRSASRRPSRRLAPPSPAGRRRAAASGSRRRGRRRRRRGRPAGATAPISTARLAPPVERGRVRKSSAQRVRGEHQPQQVLGALGVAAEPEHVLEHARHRRRHRARRWSSAARRPGPGRASPASALSTHTSLLVGVAAVASSTLASPPTSGRYADP